MMGSVAVSTADNFAVLDHLAPVVSMTSPANNNATFAAPASIPLAATVTATRPVPFVDFFANGAWIGFAGAPPYTFTYAGAGQGTYLLTAKAYNTDAVTTSAPVTVTVTPGCSYTLSSPGAQLTGSAATGTVTVTTTAGCAWQTSVPPNWIQITGGGTGSGTVTYSVSTNATGSLRTWPFTIAGLPFTITQTACTYTLSPPSVTVGNQASTGSVAIASQATCPWQAVSNNDDWLHIVGVSSGTGSATVNYSVDANTGATRQGAATIAGQTFPVTQNACPAPATPTFSRPGGVYPFSAMSIAITTSTAGATIRYTTDGSDPTASSALYGSPITIYTGTTTLKARAFGSAGRVPS